MKEILDKIAQELHAELISTLQRIIGKAKLDKEQLKFIAESFEALAKHTENTIMQMAAALQEEMRANEGAKKSQDQIWNIITALVPDDRVNWMISKDFFPMPGFGPTYDAYGEEEDKEEEDPPPLERPMFLNVPYEELGRYLEKDYQGLFQGKPFTFRLAPWSGFCNVENDLAIIAQLYGLKGPLIFSPWARRAVRLIVDDENILKNGTAVDLRLEENNLRDILLYDHVLMWNVEVRERLRLNCPSSRPDTEHIERTYLNCEDNVFLKPLWLGAKSAGMEQIVLSRGNDKIKISAPIEKDPGEECKSLKVYPVQLEEVAGLDRSILFFSNQCGNLQNILARERLRTKGEISQILNSLGNGNFSLKYAEDGKAYGKYKKSYGHQLRDYRFSQDMKNTHPWPCLFTCAARGENSGAYAKFLTDFSIYASHFLQNRYPEYAWTGVAE